ncbi:hypothetical protein [Pontiella sulfatireligans]|uniref:Uncharacterized protein n=1 Tax=Pontiella sulfatireligans TaxID=2750658 RepID=A0A6C2UQ00_9BACT|nr:hypothetical protein [Pontiella sulfatireligans]VGO22355.1 hypothetical protein SCARR_04438 [Pontiella sulfatireligans]
MKVMRCKHCLMKAEPRNGNCPACGIVPNKPKGDLSPGERRVRLHARGIRLMAMFHLVGAGAGLIMIPFFPAPLAMAVLAVVNLLLAFGLARYALPAYKAATVYYFLIGMVNVISIQHGAIHLGGIAMALLGLYLVGNSTAKAVFERRLPELL